ncbi:TonB-dependent receptor [Alteromonas sp. 5E99-2]|uniref:TonB-dependent receptor domain-containing protein n=1 Tax=Alteromonas sp. 5E99-2 TaxID=2817683 RepID=UPI001A98F0A6|nr:TonB-dependent receptor [Alteromonas sp. 5E99-2]MBO1255177.1 TonB-dependent receptor [Alteromonas sp. 5E99-2]
MFRNSKLASAVKLAGMVGAASTILTTPLYAQESSGEEEVNVEKIAVTGSRIRKADFSSNAPVATISAEQFTLTNSVNTEALLNTLPQTVPGLDRSSNNPGGGIATVNLRGLGTSRTLVLVDGIRATPTTAAGVVDINTIPAALIEDVEVLTGGASAVYGSDAVAGVVNFKLKRNFEGAEAQVSYETTEEGDAGIWNGSFTVGGNFDDNRGNVVLSLQYTEREELFAGDREISAVALDDAVAEDGSLFLESFGSSGVPGTSIFAAGLPDEFGGGGIFDPDGSFRPFVQSGEPNDFYNFAPVNYLQLPQERYNITALGRYEITDNIEVYGQGSFANSFVPQQLAATPVFETSEFTLDGNPFIDAEAQQILSDAIGGDVDTDNDGIADTATALVRRRLLEVGARIAEDTSTKFSILAGLRGAFGDSAWEYDLYYQTGEVTQDTIQLGNVNVDRFNQALLLATDESGQVILDADGNPSCSDTASNGGLTGCTPLNIFGEGNISEESAEFISTRVNSAQKFEQDVFGFNITGDTGDFFELPGGAIGLSVGFERREENFSFDPSQDLAASTIAGFNGSPPVSGNIEVNDYFVEAYLPLVSDVAFAELIDLELAYRYANYSTIGGVSSFKVAGSWAVNDKVRFRAGFNRAVRAPNIDELFSPQSEGNPSAEDPCSSQAVDQSEAVRAICLATGVPANAVFTPSLDAISGQTSGLFGGNPELQEEEADTVTIGAVFSPIEDLNISIDYFDIEIEDAVFDFGGGVNNILQSCYDTSNENGGVGSAFCDVITRRADGTIDFVEVLSQNVGKLALKGVDLSVNYSFDLAGGNMRVSYLGTYTDENSFQTSAADPVIDCAGQFGDTCGEPVQDYKHRATVQWGQDDFDVQLLWRFIGSTEDDNDDVVFVQETTGSVSYFDLTGTYYLNDHFKLNAGVRNLFEKEPLVFGANSEQSNTYPATYDVFGRTYFAGITATF